MDKMDLQLFALTQQQVENIQIDYGIVFVNYGEIDQARLGPTRGGGTFAVTKNIRDIEYDGKKGKTKGLQVVDEINAHLNVMHLDASLETLKLAMPYADYDAGTRKITCGSGALGIVPDTAYLKNITLFAKTIVGGYKKITLYNAMSESDFSLTAAPKAEGAIGLEVYAHWDALDGSANLYEMEDIQTLSDDLVKPTVTTVPADEAVGVGVSDDLTATFDKHIRDADIKSGNFLLIKALDGALVAGSLVYTPATKTATFTPTTDLEAATAYIWAITNVRDLAGNTMEPVAINFTTT